MGPRVGEGSTTGGGCWKAIPLSKSHASKTETNLFFWNVSTVVLLFPCLHGRGENPGNDKIFTQAKDGLNQQVQGISVSPPPSPHLGLEAFPLGQPPAPASLALSLWQ